MRHRKLLLEGLSLLLIFGSIWGLFIIFPVGPDQVAFRLSQEKEEKLGRLLLKATLADPAYRQVTNDTALAALDKILARLTGGLDTSSYRYSLVLVDQEMANAFALPGGPIVATNGLIVQMRSAEECAAVIAHEMGHIEHRHTLSKLMTHFTAALLLSDEALAGEAAELLTTSAFSRRQEKEADAFGLELLERTGIHPRMLGTALRHLREDYDPVYLKMEILLSHPDIDSRIRLAYQYPVRNDFREEKIGIDWEAIRNQFIHPKSQ